VKTGRGLHMKRRMPSAPGHLKRLVVLSLIAAGSVASAWTVGEQNPDGRALLMRMGDYLKACHPVHLANRLSPE